MPWWKLGSVADIRRSSRLKPEFVLLTVIASVIATLGLITDSAAVIIGAMLIAPMLTPIMGIALGALGGRSRLLLRAAVTLSAGVAITLGTSFAVTWLALLLPFDVLATIPLEVTSRTHPGPFDLAIALAGGAAAAYALVRMTGAAALFGVAIATALVPPLCTVGIGLALGDAGISTAAAILFTTNGVAITASATIVFTTLRLRPRRSRSGHSGLALAGALVVALGFVLVPSAISLAQQSRAAANQAQFADTVSQTVVDVLAERLPGCRVTDVERSQQDAVLELRVTAEIASPPSPANVATIQTDIATRLQRTVHVVIVGLPVVEIDAVASAAPSALPAPSATASVAPSPTPAPTPTPTPAPTMHPPGAVDGTAWFGSLAPRAVAAIDAQNLVLVGATPDGTAGIAATSDDGGRRWRVVRLAVGPLGGVMAADTEAWAIVPCPAGADPSCRAGFMTNSDGGTTWTMTSVPDVAGASLLDGLNGWALSLAAGSGGTALLQTADGGVTWSQGPVSCPADAPVAVGVSATSASDGWLGCGGDSAHPNAKALLSTKDGGVTWTAVALTAGAQATAGPTGAGQLPTDGGLIGIAAGPNGSGWLWTDAALYRTTDGGRRWAAITPTHAGPGTLTIESASLVDGRTGFVLVEDPAAGSVELLGTSDSGTSWTSLGDWASGSSAPPVTGPSASPSAVNGPSPAPSGAASNAP